MKNLIKLFVFILTFVFISFSAQNVDSKAENILNSVSKQYQSKKNLFFAFKYSSKKAHYSGTLFVEGQKYRLQMPDTDQIFDGRKIYTISHYEKEITISSPTENDLVISPSYYLSAYNHGYNIVYVGKKGNLDIIKLIPTQKKNKNTVILHINSAQKQILKIEQLGNNSDSFNIVSHKENLNLGNGLFSFDKNKFKNYTITDL